MHPDVQKRGLGTRLLARASADLSVQELSFAVLATGHRIAPFYESVGYEKVSETVLYLRDGKIVHGPGAALAVSFRPAFDVGGLKCARFPFGFEF